MSKLHSTIKTFKDTKDYKEAIFLSNIIHIEAKTITKGIKMSIVRGMHNITTLLKHGSMLRVLACSSLKAKNWNSTVQKGIASAPLFSYLTALKFQTFTCNKVEKHEGEGGVHIPISLGN